MKTLNCAIFGAGFLLALSTGAQAAVVRLDESQFMASAGLITFSEVALGTQNPTFAPADYGGGPGSPTVTTGGFFLGQSLSAAPAIDCPGAAASACVVGNPTGPLSLDPAAPVAFTADDVSTPTSPTLSGSPLFNGPVALHFSEDQTGVGFTAGFFNAVGSTGITAFARDGSLLGTVVNELTGIEFLGLATEDNLPGIAGVFLDLVGAEPAGFVIDNLRFGQAADIAPIPLPAGLPLLAAALAVLGFTAHRKRSA